MLAVLASFAAGPAHAQFLDEFAGPALARDPAGLEGWAAFTGDGEATIDLRQGDGHASVLVDATRDRRGIWWAVIRRRVSEGMDLTRLAQAGQELRIETRLRVSHAPRRVNLHLNTQRTTDFHSHLMEFDIPDAGRWHTVSMTTRDFPAWPGDTVFGQMALIDWGLESYQVDVDYFKVDVVDAARAGPDQGEAVPYHPAVPPPSAFAHVVAAAHDAMIDLEHPDVNLDDWAAGDRSRPRRVLTVDGTHHVILRFDLGAFAGRRAAGHGLLELTTHSVQRLSREVKDFGLVRVVEILGGDPAWDQRTVTTDGLRRGDRLDRVLNTQMIVDWPVAQGAGARTYFTISKPVLQRLLDGRTHGLALKALGAISASFDALESEPAGRSARLLFNLE
jgi:hypothetical protein